MAYKSKFLHFKTKASYNAERAKTTAGTEERKVFDAYISFIDEGPMICTWGKEYKCDISASEVEALVAAGKISPATVAPLIAGTAAVGTSAKYAREDHRHPEQINITGNAETATKLATAKTVSLSGDVTGSTTFDGSKNVAITTTVKNVHEGSITWGGKDTSGNFGPLDAGLVPELGANRFAFLKPAGLSAEYSIDGGTTWIEYPNNINLSGGIFGAGKGPSLTIDPLNNKENITSLYKVRVTINANKSGIYTELNKFIIYLSTNGSSGCTVDLTGKKNGSDDYVNLKTGAPISGWPGYNVINRSLILGGRSTDYISDLRFTFNITSHNSNYSGLLITQILAFGGVGWTTPSVLAKTGHLYSCNLDQNATFPSSVIANKFTTVGGTANNLVAGNGSLINITDIKNGGSANNLSSARTFALIGEVTGSASSDLTNGVSIDTTLSNLDASKITSGTINADRLPEIPISKIPAAAMERLYVVESQSAAMSLTIQEGDVVQIGSGGPMYFCVSESASTFATKFKEFTAGSATSVPWSGVTNAPTKLSQFTNDAGFLTSVPAQSWTSITGKPTFATVATSGSYNDLTNKPTIPSLSGYATQNWVTSQGYLTSIPAASTTVVGGIKLNGNNSQYLAGDGSFYEIDYNEINGTPDIATANTAGLVKPINVVTKPTLNSITTTSGRYYSVQMSNDGNMFVNVPWTSSSIPSNNITGSGTSGYLAKFNGTNTITSGPKLSSSSSGLFLRDDGTWQIPFDISINGSGTIDSFSYQLNLNAGTGGISITNDEDNTYSINAVAASTSQFGTVKVGSNITLSSGTISLSKSNVTSALGYTPANTSDIPEIPIALPNPYALTINGTSYTGSSVVSINTARILSTSTLSSSTVSAGYSYNNTSSRTISSLSGFSSSNPDSVIISTAKLTFTASNAIKMDGLADLSGTYYIYCLSYMANGKIAVNGAVYA